ncbi:MAG: DUF177 domain-containing protein [Bdellovibrionota bacterium]
MKIYLHEITDEEIPLDFDENESWVKSVIEKTDEASFNAISKPRSTRLHLALRKVDDVVMLSGHVDTSLNLICSRCATPFLMNCDAEFSALFCKDPAMAGVGFMHHPGKPSGQNHGVAKHRPAKQVQKASHHLVSENDDLDITYLSEDHLDLADVLGEQLQLQLPFQPLCKKTCKGMCTKCGADLNNGRCACGKLATEGVINGCS